MNLGAYAKMWAAIVPPALGILFGMLSPETTETVMTWVTPVVTALAVYAVPNTPLE